MLSYIRLTTLALFVAICAAQTISSGRYNIDVNLPDGTQLKFHYFDQSINHIEPQLKNMMETHMAELLDYIKGIVFKELDKPGSTGITGWIKVATNLISTVRRQKAERVALNCPFPKEKDYNSKSSKFFKELLEESRELAKNSPKLTNEQLKDKIDSYLKHLQAMIQASPVGPYILFETAQMGGKTLQGSTLEIMAGLRNSGFGKFLSAVDKLLSLIAMF